MKYYIKVNACPNDVEVVEIEDGKSIGLEYLQRSVGGWIERVPMGRAVMVVNEEGLIYGLCPNIRASVAVRMYQKSKGIPPEWRCSGIVGNAIICTTGHKGLSLKDANKMLTLLGASLIEG